MTSLDLVRKIRANPKGSDFQDVKHVEDFVNEKINERVKTRMELIAILLEGVPIDYSKHARLKELLTPPYSLL